MSLFFKRATFGPTAEEIVGRSMIGRTGRVVTSEQAMRHSAVWACIRLRADLISTSPVDCYRNAGDHRLSVPTPQVLVNPGGERVDVTEWLYSTQADLDRFGNTFGLITARDGQRLPARIDLVPAETVTVKVRDGELAGYRIGGKEYDPSEVWHERQFTSAGMHVGLSPIAHAAATLSAYVSAEQFAAEWFRGNATPSARMKNTAKVITPDEADKVKARYRATMTNGDLLVHGMDWDFEMIGAKASDAQFLETMKASISDICRFLGVPGDLVDAETTTGAITYANVTQRNLQLLILNLGPAIVRRERALSNLLPRPRYVKLNTDAVVLRMDPLTRAQMAQVQIESRTRTPDEVREKDDLAPLTPADIEKFHELFPPKGSTSVPGPEGAPA